MTDEFLANRVIELEDENAKLRDRIKWLTITVASMAAGPMDDVSPEQFSMLVAEHEAMAQ